MSQHCTRDQGAPVLPPSVGASWAIFGAFGAYLILRRRELGPVAGPLTSQWVFVLVLNLFISVSVPNIALWDQIGGLVAGLAIGAFLLALQRSREVR